MNTPAVSEPITQPRSVGTVAAIAILAFFAMYLLLTPFIETWAFYEFVSSRIESFGVPSVMAYLSAEESAPHGEATRRTVAAPPPLREPESRTVKLDLEPAHSIDGWDMYLWVREITLYKDRTVLRFACRSADPSKDGFLVVHFATAGDQKPRQAPYLATDGGEIAELVNDPLDKTREPMYQKSLHKIAQDTGYPLKIGQTLTSQIEFQAVPMDSTHLKLFHRQFGTIDIPLGDPKQTGIPLGK